MCTTELGGVADTGSVWEGSSRFQNNLDKLENWSQISRMEITQEGAQNTTARCWNSDVKWGLIG